MMKAKPLAPDQAVDVALLLHPRADLVARRLLRLVDILQNDHLGAEDRAFAGSRQANPACQTSAASPLASTKPVASTSTSP